MQARATAATLGLPALAWLAALSCLQQAPNLPGVNALRLMLAGVLALAFFAKRGHGRLLCLCGCAFLLALIWGTGRAQLRLENGLPEAWEGRDIWLQGEVDSLPQGVVGGFGGASGGEAGWRFKFIVERAEDERGHVLPQIPRRVILTAYLADDASANPWRAGQRWRLQARLRRPSGLINPGGFDYELWLFEQNLGATGSVRPTPAQRLPDAWGWHIDALRQDMREAINRHVANAESAALITALSLGDQSGIAQKGWDLYRDSGISHLVAISGMHVTLLAWFVQAFAARLWRRSARACALLPAPTLGLWVGAATALFYALFSGWGVPAQRTVWMLLSLALLRAGGLRWPWPLALLVAAVVVTLIDPWALTQPGFWLSFVAVALLMASGRSTPQGWRQHISAGLRAQGVATLGLAPLTLLFFQQISLVGLLANLIAIPLVSLVITPLALGGVAWPWLWQVAAWSVQALHAYLHLLQTIPGAVLWLPTAPPWAMALGLAGGVLAVLPLPWRVRVLAPLLMLGLLWPALPRPALGQFALMAPDVGQGMSVWVKTRSHNLIFDAGPRWGPSSDAGERVLIPMLRAHGVNHVDVLLLSHRDTDHVGGAASLMSSVRVDELLSSLEPNHPLLRHVASRRCEAGQQWQWDGVSFAILAPTADDYAHASKSNAISCVLHVTDAAGHSALLAGDIEAPQERGLLARGEDVRSEMLLVPHHGSNTSSTEPFLEAVAPRLALVQSGYRNRFGHPTPAVMARYQALDIAVQTSPDCGAWTWAPGARPQCERESAKRYWQRQPTPVQAAMHPEPWEAEPGE